MTPISMSQQGAGVYTCDKYDTYTMYSLLGLYLWEWHCTGICNDVQLAGFITCDMSMTPIRCTACWVDTCESMTLIRCTAGWVYHLSRVWHLYRCQICWILGALIETYDTYSMYSLLGLYLWDQWTPIRMYSLLGNLYLSLRCMTPIRCTACWVYTCESMIHWYTFDLYSLLGLYLCKSMTPVPM